MNWPRAGFFFKHRQISCRQILNQAGKFSTNFRQISGPHTLSAHAAEHFPRPRQARERVKPTQNAGACHLVTKLFSIGCRRIVSLELLLLATSLIRVCSGIRTARRCSANLHELRRPHSVCGTQTGRFLADFDLEYRVNITQAYFSKIFARCARRQILNRIWKNPALGQFRNELLRS